MKKYITRKNILFIAICLILVVPQTRTPLQVFLHKGLSLVNQSTLIEETDRVEVEYNSWKLISENGEPVEVESINKKVIFINFWATWCPPCIAEMPSLQLLYNDYQDDILFLFITNDDLDLIQKFKTKNNYTFEVFNSINEIPSELVTNSIPRTFIINKKSQVVVDESGAINWNSIKVRQQLNQLINE